MLDWNLTEGSKNTNTGTKFTKFPEGITKIRVLLGPGERPFTRWTHWLDQFSRKITCPGHGCPIEAIIKADKDAGNKPKYSVARSISLNIFNLSTGQAELLEEGITMVETLQDAISEAFEDNPTANISEMILKVRKKKNASGKWAWTISLDEILPLNEAEQKALDDRIKLDEYFTTPTIDQVKQLLAVQATSKDEYISAYVDIMGFTKKDEPKDEKLGIEVE